ncbi:alpha/beta hydrolase family protein [Streptomyces triticirhizae]|uniref:serine peptidase n=1 Tax=Streptomyces triticirhizae TaxID=2483353 RepID=UPI0011C40876|nr:serine peptidase [Streptomyces triticirhizae]
MTRALGIHGVRNYRAGDADPEAGATRLRAAWAAALGPDSGLDLRTAYYADLLRGQRQGDQLDEAEAEFVTRWAAAWGVDTSAVQGRATGWLRWVCGQVAQRAGAAPAVVERAVRLFFPEVTRYFGAPARERVLDRVVRALERHRPRIVIAHSLGSVVAYEALHRLPEPRVDLFLTLGSPLALPAAIFDRLQPPPVAGLGARPPGVARWVNVADVGDFVAVPRGRLARVFAGVESVDDISVAPLWPHNVLDYLGHSVVRDILAVPRGQ